MKKPLKSIISLILILALCVSLIPVPYARGISLSAGEFNPNTGKVRVDFKIQLTQLVSIEVLVNGEHFGWLMKNAELTGYSGELNPKDPCTQEYEVPELPDQSGDAGEIYDWEAEGNEWHHIVEQCQSNPNRANFAVKSIQNTNNIISIPKEIHQKISAYYSSTRPFTNGMIFRDWLNGKSFEEQFAWGIKILRDYGVTF